MSRQTTYRTTGPAFRPSVYSTGVEKLQPYGPGWAQGTSYGNPLSLLRGLFSKEEPEEVDEDVSFWELVKGAASGAATGAASGGYDAYMEEQARIERERAAEARSQNIMLLIGLGIPLTFIGYQLYKKGK